MKVEAKVSITTRQMKDMSIAISLGLPISECASPVNTPELENMWVELEKELAEIRAKGWVVDIPWDPFDE